MEYSIRITGEGNPKDIVKALRQVASAIESETIRESLDSTQINDLDGAQWEDCTLMTEISAISTDDIPEELFKSQK